MKSFTSRPVGYGANATGGGNAAPVVVRNKTEFVNAVSSSDPKVIIVDGFFEIGYTLVKANKTIQGFSSESGVSGTIRIENVNNVIVQGLKCTAPAINGKTYDAIAIATSRDIWIDHCTFYDWTDGACDIVKSSDYVTVSCCYFYQTRQYEHSLAILIGSDKNDPDADKLHVTGYLNWFGKNVYDRMPFNRGNSHFFNNLYDAAPYQTSYITAARSNIYLENNYFNSGEDPYIYKESGGKMKSVGDFHSPNVTEVNIPNNDVLPPGYTYSKLPVEFVQNMVMRVAGSAGEDLPTLPPVDPPVEPVPPPENITVTDVITLTAYTVDRLSNDVAANTIALVTDANGIVMGEKVTGGGEIKTLVLFTGTIWVVI